jgi:hypothetical protein
MRAPGPAARPPHALNELRAYPFDMRLPCLGLLYGSYPANPFVPCQRGNVFPRHIGFWRPAPFADPVVSDAAPRQRALSCSCGHDSNGPLVTSTEKRPRGQFAFWGRVSALLSPKTPAGPLLCPGHTSDRRSQGFKRAQMNLAPFWVAPVWVGSIQQCSSGRDSNCTEAPSRSCRFPLSAPPTGFHRRSAHRSYRGMAPTCRRPWRSVLRLCWHPLPPSYRSCRPARVL